jgi:hypothetical protein
MAASDDLLPPAPLNPTGFWESASLNDVNDEILRRFGGDSGSPPLLPPGWEFDRRLDDLRDRAERCFLGTFTTTQWIWKDPRNCLTFPFWQLVTGVRAIVLIVYRNPLEVAASLLAHHGVKKSAALRVWERYVLDSLTHARGLPAYALCYVDLISAPAAVAADLHQFLSRLDLRLSQLDAVSNRISCFVSSALRHYHADAEDVARDPDVTKSQRRLFTWLEGIGGAHPWLPAPREAGRAPGRTSAGREAQGTTQAC